METIHSPSISEVIRIALQKSTASILMCNLFLPKGQSSGAIKKEVNSSESISSITTPKKGYRELSFSITMSLIKDFGMPTFLFKQDIHGFLQKNGATPMPLNLTIPISGT